jgi:hypothetical protein
MLYAGIEAQNERAVPFMRLTIDLPEEEINPAEIEEQPKRRTGPRPPRLNAKPAELTAPPVPAAAPPAPPPPGQPVREQLEYADAILRNPKNGIRNGQGFYISRLLENFPVPQRRQRQENMERQALEITYSEYRREATDRYIDEHVPAQDLAALVKREIAKLRAGQWKDLPAQTLSAMADRAVRASLAEKLPIPLLTIDEYREREGPALFLN